METKIRLAKGEPGHPAGEIPDRGRIVQAFPSKYLDALRLDGRGFVVLGAAGGGIGSETSLALAEAGADLLLVDVNPDQAGEAARMTGGEAIVADIRDRAAMESLFQHAQAKFGARFHGVVDVVGMVARADLLHADETMIDAQFDVVLRHAIHAIQIAGPMLAANGAGSMVFVGSLAGMSASGANAFYGAAKAALHHLIRYAARELGPRGVRVNGVAPGLTRTPRIVQALPAEIWSAFDAQSPLGRAAEPEDIARTILFLASDLASYVTGNIIALDAGASNNVTQPHHIRRD
jgi:NAD(P)-dependent dehydrogenase (short-subunit alcohol dehydrogenase family)